MVLGISQCVNKQTSVDKFNYVGIWWTMNLHFVIICPIAIAYSMGQITRSSTGAKGPRDAPQIRNIAFEKACSWEWHSRTFKVITVAAIRVSVSVHVCESPTFSRLLGKRGGGTRWTSDFIPEIEIWQFRACTMKTICNIILINWRMAKIPASRCILTDY